MKIDISSVMGKLKGAEIGKLKAKDYIGILTGINPTYSEDDFDNAINKQDRDNKVNFLNYGHLSKELMILCLNYRIIVDQIEKLTFKLNWFRLFISSMDFIDIGRESLTIERIKNHFGDDPGEQETGLRDFCINIRDGLLDEREGISQIYDTLKYGITHYFVCKDMIKALSERLDFPELEAVINDDPLPSVENLNAWALDLPKDNPYKELFQAIDIESLKNVKQFDVKKKVDELMTWLD